MRARAKSALVSLVAACFTMAGCGLTDGSSSASPKVCSSEVALARGYRIVDLRNTIGESGGSKIVSIVPGSDDRMPAVVADIVMVPPGFSIVTDEPTEDIDGYAALGRLRSSDGACEVLVTVGSGTFLEESAHSLGVAWLVQLIEVRH